MTVEEISKFAAESKKVAGMTCAERCLFYELRDLYRDFKEGRVTKGEGETRKKTAVAQYEKDHKEEMGEKEYYAKHAEFWKRIETAGSEYAKNPSIEAADRFFKAVYGVDRLKERQREVSE